MTHWWGMLSFAEVEKSSVVASIKLHLNVSKYCKNCHFCHFLIVRKLAFVGI